jgi:hypothetical protein
VLDEPGWHVACSSALDSPNQATLTVFDHAQSVIFWQIFWQAALGAHSAKVFVLVGATGIEPVTSAV